MNFVAALGLLTLIATIGAGLVPNKAFERAFFDLPMCRQQMRAINIHSAVFTIACIQMTTT